MRKRKAKITLSTYITLQLYNQINQDATKQETSINQIVNNILEQHYTKK